jgi:nitroreductase
MAKKPNEVMEPHNFRHACKEFDLEKRVSEEDMVTILEVARLSPSSFGFEPWKFLVIEDVYLREKISSVSWGMQRQLSTLSYLIVILSRKTEGMIYSSKYIRYIMEEIQKIPEDMINKGLDRYKNFQEYDFNLLDNERAMFDWTSKQSYIPLANMMTTAASMGIDSCPIEGFNREKLECLLDKEGILDIEDFGVSVMVAFGYRSEDPKRLKKRRPFNEVVEWIR